MHVAISPMIVCALEYLEGLKSVDAPKVSQSAARTFFCCITYIKEQQNHDASSVLLLLHTSSLLSAACGSLAVVAYVVHASNLPNNACLLGYLEGLNSVDAPKEKQMAHAVQCCAGNTFQAACVKQQHSNTNLALLLLHGSGIPQRSACDVSNVAVVVHMPVGVPGRAQERGRAKGGPGGFAYSMCIQCFAFLAPFSCCLH
jgi:hypothetical protein